MMAEQKEWRTNQEDKQKIPFNVVDLSYTEHYLNELYYYYQQK